MQGEWVSYWGDWEGRPFRVRVFPGGMTLSLDMHHKVRVYTYDATGRPWTFLLEGRVYRRALNGSMLVKWREPGGPRQRLRLPPEEARREEARAREYVAAWVQALRTGRARTRTPLPHRVWELLERILAFDEARSREDAARYLQVYKPIGILPPDQYLSVVVQVTEGCSFNTCTFCTFYRDRPFRIKTPEALARHIQAVRDYLGEGLFLRRHLFLGDANALVVPMPRLLPLLEEVRRGFPEERFQEMYAFLDGFSGEKKSPEDYARLRALGLQRVYIGLESGDPDLLRFLRKPGTPQDAVHAVRAMKAGGLAVGVIVLLGAGGHRYAQGHVQHTVEVLRAMNLERGDLLYFSELVVTPEMPYARDALREGIRALTPEEQKAQMEAILKGLAYPKGGGPHVSKYDIREFVY